MGRDADFDDFGPKQKLIQMGKKTHPKEDTGS